MKQFFNFIVNRTTTSLPSREGSGVGFNDFSLRMGQKTPPYLRKFKTVHCASISPFRGLGGFTRVSLILLVMVLSVNVWGAAKTYRMTPDQTTTGSSATAYITSLTEFTHDEVNWKMNQWNPKTLQIKTNQSLASSEFRFYNTSAFAGKITQVVVKFSALTLSNTTTTGFKFVGGSSEISGTTGGTDGVWNSTAKTLTWTPDAESNYTYFAMYQNGKVATGTNNLATADAIVVTYEAAAATSHTVTFNAGSGTCSTSSLTETSADAGVTLPSASPSSACGTAGWTFAGWKETSAQTETTTAPTLLAAGANYKPSSNCTLYAVYSKTESSGGGTPSLTKMVKGNTIAAGDKLVIVANNTTYAMYQTSASSYVSYVTFSSTVSDYSDAKRYFEVSIGSTGGYCLGDATNGYLYSSSSTNLDVSTTNKTEFNFIDNNDGTFKFQGKSATTRYLDCRTDLTSGNANKWRFGSSGTQNLDLYKYSAGGTSTTTYTTSPSCGPATYTVSFCVNPAGYGTVSQASLANVASGTSISANGAILTVGSTSITATPATATAQYTYTFNNWTWSPTGSTITAATTATANFNRTENSYTVSYSDDGKVDYTNKPTSVLYSETGLTISATPKSGYNITGVAVTMGGSPMSNNDYMWEDGELTIMPTNFTGNIVITFTTELVQTCTNEITITQGTPSNGSFSLSQTGIVCIDDGNATVNVTNISPAEHYHFKQITATNGSVDNEHKQVTNISANTTINVEFEEDPKYTITFVDAVHGESVTPKSVYENETFTFPSITDKTAVAPTGDCVADHYHFIGWVEDGTTPTQSPSNVITAGTTSIKITENVTYKAVWAKEEL